MILKQMKQIRDMLNLQQNLLLVRQSVLLPKANSDDPEKLAVEDIRAESIAERYQTAKKILIENWKEPLRPGQVEIKLPFKL